MKKKFNDIKITNKLLLTFMIIIILYIASVGSALYSVKSITNSFQDFHDRSYEIVKYSTDFRLNQYVVARNMLQIINEADTAESAEEMTEVTTSIATIEEAVKELKVLYAGTQTLEELTEMYDNLVPAREKVLTLLKSGNYKEGLRSYNEEYAPRSKEARVYLRDLEAQARADAEANYDNSKTSANQMMITLLFLGAITLLFVCAIWYIISKSITKPILVLKNAAKELADGNLRAEIDYTSENELGSLADSMRNTITTLHSYIVESEKTLSMIGKGKLNHHTDMQFKGDFIALQEAIHHISDLLSDSMLQISNSAEQVSGGAQQISNGAQMLSQGASEQAGSIEELAANINEISDSVKNNADDTIAASNLADEVEKEIMENSAQMDNVTDAINQIKQTSMNITGIVKEIEDIAFQTNLLALNAAVEAARAGDAGRGFSVVASEIRKLASKTTEASKSTAELIQKSTKSVEKGSTLVHDSEQSLKHIVDGARDVASKIERISQSNIQQANFIIQIRQSIEQISDIVQGNSATSEESAAASEELAAQAQILKELVNRFELKERDEII